MVCGGGLLPLGPLTEEDGDTVERIGLDQFRSDLFEAVEFQRFDWYKVGFYLSVWPGWGFNFDCVGHGVSLCVDAVGGVVG